jgi:hypothetical protein
MDGVFTVLGLGLVGFGLYDVFRGLLYPSGRGTISYCLGSTGRCNTGLVNRA